LYLWRRLRFGICTYILICLFFTSHYKLRSSIKQRTHKDLFQTTVNCMLLIYNLFDIFMVMYLGNEIKLFSDRLSYCFFQSNWMDQSSLNKNCIIILAEVLKRPQEMVIAKLYPLDLKTFTSVVTFKLH